MASPPLESKARGHTRAFIVCLGEKICQQVALNICHPQFEKLANFCNSPNFRQSSRNLMSCLGGLQILAKQTFMFFNHLDFQREKSILVRLSSLIFLAHLRNEFERCFHSNVCDSYHGSGYAGSN